MNSNGWISVDSRLPDMKEMFKDGPLHSSYCLVFTGHQIMQGKLGQTYKKRIQGWRNASGHSITVTHWMPYPDPPTQEEK